jgi:hypothetical protein
MVAVLSNIFYMYNKKKFNNVLNFLGTIKNLDRFNGTVQSGIKEVECFFNGIRSGDTVMENTTNRHKEIAIRLGVQIMAATICVDLYRAIKDMYKEEKHQITIYRIFEWDKKKEMPCCGQHDKHKGCLKNENNKHERCLENENKSTEHRMLYCNMIACKNEQGERLERQLVPQCFNYAEKDGEKIKQYYYVKIFKRENDYIQVLLNKEEIAKQFLIHKSSEDRERRLQQYIGIPLLCDGQIVALLQIDTEIESQFGKTKDEIIELSNNMFRPYINQLLPVMRFENLSLAMVDQFYIQHKKQSKPR